MPSIFEKIKKQASTRGISFSGDSKKASTWFANKAKSLGGNVSAGQLMGSTKARQTTKRPRKGDMVHFFYDPKLKKTLPFYDKFPLIFIIEFYKDGFLGINLHYLPPKLRLNLLDKLITLESNKKYDESTRLRVSYSILNATSRFKEFKPTIKRYLTNHIRSNFLKVNSDEWHMSIFLPTAKFTKASAQKVWSDSRKKIGKK